MSTSAIPGLDLIENYLTPEEQPQLLAAVDALPWRDDLQRRVQHHGWIYDYRARRVHPSMYIGPLPSWAEALARRLTVEGHFRRQPDMLIVNEYCPGQGISAHVDCRECFSDVICSVSLGSQCMMKLAKLGEEDHVETILLRPGSLLVLSQDARYRWTHAIPARKSDRIDGRAVRRGRRVSLTFRTVKLQVIGRCLTRCSI